MASLPPQQQRQRRSSPQNTAADESSQDQGDRVESSDTTQPIILDSSQSTEQTGAKPQKQEEEPRKCWICFSDETEDTPDSSIWRTPCPCALTAHESCLLDWVADIEAPNSSRSTSTPTEIRCPQCKNEIFLARPRSYIVEAYSALEQMGSHFLWPGIFGGLSYTILLSCSHHGASTIRMVFGPEDAAAILAPVQHWTWLETHALKHFPTLVGPILRNWRGWRVELGLPLIPMILVASRTTLFDPVLPALPIIFFATQKETVENLELSYWPPSASLAFVLLPYVRGAYDELQERVWGARERAWIKETRPQLTQEAENEDGEEGGGEGDDDVIELGIEVRVVDEDEEDEAAEEAAEEAREIREVQEAIRRDEGADAMAGDEEDGPLVQEGEEQPAQGQAQQGQAQQNQQNQGRHNHDINLLFHVTRMADTTFGALLFPSISALSGELLRLSLPTSWTTTSGNKASGLLQTRWGRSILGGCLFVVLKDMVRIYARWRMAVAFRQRRIRDYDKKTGKLV